MELKPCPFCGGDAVKGMFSIWCDQCNGSSPENVGGEDAEILASWNTRPLEDALQAKLDEAKAFHPRAMKLIEKKKSFLVVACDEPYYLDVYLFIKRRELATGRWTFTDEKNYLEALKKLEAE